MPHLEDLRSAMNKLHQSVRDDLPITLTTYEAQAIRVEILADETMPFYEGDPGDETGH